MTTRLFVVGTDTGVGKTEVTAALLRRALQDGRRVLPFKPVQSGGELEDDTDVARLCDAAGLDAELRAKIAPLRYAEPVAPGVAHDREQWRGAARPSPAPLERALAQLRALEREHDPSLTLIEGAGGLEVPMPGGTWQRTWMRAFEVRVLVVGRIGLGTLNHTRLTVAALSDFPIAGVILCDPDGDTSDPARADNLAILARHLPVPVLGELRHGHGPYPWPGPIPW